MITPGTTSEGSQRVSIREAFDPRMIAVASVTVMGSFMSMLDSTIVNIALPTLLRTFKTSLSNVQWVSTSYLLALAVVVPLTRLVADRFGTKRVWLISVTLFTIGSLLCGLSWSLPSLIVARVLQGLGGGMIMPIGQTILARQAGPSRLGRVMTVVAVPQFLAPLLGPVAGGLILSSFSWRWIFFINVPIGVIAVIRGLKILERGDFGASRKVDVVGIFLFSPGLGLMVYGIAQFGNLGSFTPVVLSTFLGGLTLVVLFVVHAFRVEHPLLNLRLWRNHSLAAATVVVFFFGMSLQSAILLVQLYFQLGRGYTPLHTAILLAPAAVGAIIALPNAGTIMDRHGARAIVPVGLVITGIAIFPFTQITPKTSILMLMGFWFLRGIGTSSVGTPASAAAYSTLRRDEIPGATTINNISGRVGSSFGVAIAAVLLQRRLVRAIPGGSVAALSKLSTAHRASDAFAISNAFRDVFWFTAILIVIAIIPARRLPKRSDIIAFQKSIQDPLVIIEPEAADTLTESHSPVQGLSTKIVDAADASPSSGPPESKLTGGRGGAGSAGGIP
ncbi:MAG TPA: MDR family MFS transporter [Galbitalea sp.]